MESSRPRRKGRRLLPGYLAVTLGIGFGAGLLGKLSGIPAGTMIFAMAAVSVYNVITGKGYLPMWLKKAAQMCSGALIGVQVCREDLQGLSSVLLLEAGSSTTL